MGYFLSHHVCLFLRLSLHSISCSFIYLRGE